MQHASLHILVRGLFRDFTPDVSVDRLVGGNAESDMRGCGVSVADTGAGGLDTGGGGGSVADTGGGGVSVDTGAGGGSVSNTRGGGGSVADTGGGDSVADTGGGGSIAGTSGGGCLVADTGEGGGAELGTGGGVIAEPDAKTDFFTSQLDKFFLPPAGFLLNFLAGVSFENSQAGKKTM